ncbi:MAG TPA: hypothetical protein VKA21_05550 [Candidatus Binatia bacterium]|nr:hypothetical protein [Candidatus Binatia bacterium]
MQPLKPIATKLALAVAVLATVLPGAALAQSRDLNTYVLFALRELRTKGISVPSGGDIGVNEPNGLLSASSHGEIDAPASQVVADVVRASTDSRCARNGLFSNLVYREMPGCAPPARVTLPIIANPAQACGFPATFPACGGRSILVFDGQTQVLSATNGPFGDVRVLGGGTLILSGGNYVFCRLRAGRNARIVARGPSTMSVVNDMNVGNGAFVGPDPGAPAVGARDVKFLVNGLSAHFSGSADVHASVCAPNARMRITHGATLQGTFVAQTIRTERIGATPPTTTTLPSGSTTTSTTRAATTSTTRASTTTTTTIPSCDNPDLLCGNGHIDCSEECDGDDFGDAVCPGGTGELVCTPECTIDFSRCPCGNGVKDATEECDPTAAPTGCAANETCGPLSDSATACRCVAGLQEICGNCIDDDLNDLTDFEDPACCPTTTTFTMSVTRGRLKPRGGLTKLVLRSLLASRGLENVDPRQQDVFVQIRQPNGSELLCAKAPKEKFMRMHRAFKFWDKKHKVQSARGIQDIKVKARKKKGGVRFRAFGKRVEFHTPASGALQVTVGFYDPSGKLPNACSTQVQAFRSGRKGRLRAP